MTKKIKNATLLMAFVAIAVAAVLAVSIAETLVELGARYVPDYEKINLRALPGIGDGNFSDDGYYVIFKQTGLGKDAVDRVFLSVNDPVSMLEVHQGSFFEPPALRCNSIGVITSEERLFSEDGKVVKAFGLADVREGDILITKATHSLGWRHGHAGIVVDADKGRTLEAALWGMPSEVFYLSKWRSYPSFIQLRHKDKKLGKEASAIALEKLRNIDYGLTTGLFTKFAEKPSITQCAHLPWYAYMSLGYDIDSNGGWLVTPNDIVGSEFLEIVQIYGVDPDKIW